jgi:hypothetical protein
MSGIIIDLRDQVRMIRLSPALLAASTLRTKCPSTNGPFFNDLAILFHRPIDYGSLLPMARFSASTAASSAPIAG